MGIKESWTLCSEDVSWTVRDRPDYQDYKQAYENLQTTFNPVEFDPARWARAASDAGMKYMVFTTKHHDGFCMYDSKLTDYKITGSKTPFHTDPGADVTRELFDAFRAEGMWVGAYFSKPDWHSDDFWWPYFATPDRNANYDPEKHPERWEKFVRFTHGQMMELLGGNYGKVDILWLDGMWVQKMTPEEERLNRMDTYNFGTLARNQDIRMDEFVAGAREKQPGLIVVDRGVHGKNQNYLTPENVVPEKALPYPWESCIITAGRSWAWKPGAEYMSTREAIHMLVDVVTKGGNLLLNIAPGPRGQWQEGAYRLLEEIGGWMAVNAEAIYGTGALAPHKEGKVCISRKGEDTLYLYYLADEKEDLPAEIGMTSFSLPPGTKLELLGSPGKTLSWRRNGNGFLATVPGSIRKNPPCSHVWVIRAVIP